MDFIYEYVERFFEKVPISKKNRKLKEAFVRDIVKEYNELKKENSDEKCIEILNNKYGWIDNLYRENEASAVFLSIDGMTISDSGVVFDPSDEEYKSDRTYQLLEELCDISFCYARRKEDFIFDCSERFVVFALDKCRNYFGSIGDYCRLTEPYVPIGYVRQEGLYSRIANNLKEFLELAVFYPYWYNVIELERMRKGYTLDKLEQEWIMNIPDFYKKQKEISDALQIHKNEKSLELLFDNLRMESEFVVCNIDDEYNNYEKLL